MKTKISALFLSIFFYAFHLSAVSIACLDFVEENSSDSKHSKILPQLLLVELSKRPDIRFMERTEMSKILKEHELSLMSQNANLSTMLKVGNLCHADYVLYGRIYSMNDKTYINIKLVNCKSGKIQGTVFTKDSVLKDKELADVVQLIAKFITSTFSQ